MNYIIVGVELDNFFGPMGLRARAFPYFLDYKGDCGDTWDSIHIPRLRIIRAGLNVASVSVDYVHPIEQTAEETGNLDFISKRVIQLQNLIGAFRKEAGK